MKSTPKIGDFTQKIAPMKSRPSFCSGLGNAPLPWCFRQGTAAAEGLARNEGALSRCMLNRLTDGTL